MRVVGEHSPATHGLGPSPTGGVQLSPRSRTGRQVPPSQSCLRTSVPSSQSSFDRQGCPSSGRRATHVDVAGSQKRPNAQALVAPGMHVAPATSGFWQLPSSLPFDQEDKQMFSHDEKCLIGREVAQ